MVSVKSLFSGKMDHIFIGFYGLCMIGCALVFPLMALVQLGYSLFLLYIKEKRFWLHLFSAVGLGVCLVIFMLLLSKGFIVTV